MSITLKQGLISYKDSNGVYQRINTIGETTTAEQVASIQSAGTQALTSVQTAKNQAVAKVQETAEGLVPYDYTELVGQVEDVKDAIVKVAPTQPTEPVNKLWIKSNQGTETEIPTYEEFSDLKSAFNYTTGIVEIAFTSGKYINTAVSVGGTVDITEVANASWKCAVVNCAENDGFILNVKGGNTPRAWCFVDSNNKVISVSNNSVTLNDSIMFAPKGATKLILNDNNSTLGNSFYKPLKTVWNRIDNMVTELANYKAFMDTVFSGQVQVLSSQSGTFYIEYDIVQGKKYTIYNETDVAIAIRTGNTTSGDTVQSISDGLYANNKITFIASANAKYFRLVVGTTATGKILMYDEDSWIVVLDKEMLKSNVNAKEYPISRTNKDTNGIEFEWAGETCHISGTASALAFDRLFYNLNAFPDGMSAGGTYQILFDGINSELRVYYSSDGESINYTNNVIIITNDNAEFTIPSNATGVDIYLSVKSGISANEYVHPYITNTWSNQELAKEAKIVYRSNFFKTGKTLVTLGDSIFGNNADSGTGAPDFIAKHSDMTVINGAFGGTRMVKRSNDITQSRCAFDFENLVDAIIDNDFSAQEQAIIDHPSDILPYYSDRLTALKNVDWSEVDFITINYGTNDWEAGTSTQSYITAYEASLIKFMTEFPHIRVFVITPTFRFWIDENLEVIDDSNTRTFGNPAINLPTFNESLITVTNDLNLNLIDCYSIGINRYNWTHYFSQYDTTHQSYNGRELIGTRVANQIMCN